MFGAYRHREVVSAAVEKILDCIEYKGDSRDGALLREGLRETPERVLKYYQEIMSGYDEADPAALLKSFIDGADGCDEMVFEGGIPFYSMCEHHMAPFFGVAHIGYIPNKEIVGLSKIPRLLDVFAKRLQVQERLGNQVADMLYEGLQARGVGVVLRARHLCMESRGVRKTGVLTYTSSLRGAFKDDARARSEFLTFVQMADQRMTAV